MRSCGIICNTTVRTLRIYLFMLEEAVMRRTGDIVADLAASPGNVSIEHD